MQINASVMSRQKNRPGISMNMSHGSVEMLKDARGGFDNKAEQAVIQVILFCQTVLEDCHRNRIL